MAREERVDRSKERLKATIKSEITQLFESALDYAHVACPPDNYKALRSKILRVGNNCIRNLQLELNRYDLEFKPVSEDIVEIKRS